MDLKEPVNGSRKKYFLALFGPRTSPLRGFLVSEINLISEINEQKLPRYDYFGRFCLTVCFSFPLGL
jgi:hypothetical protein